MTNITQGTGQPYELGSRLYTLARDIDCSQTSLAATTAHEVLNIPPMTWVLLVRLKVATAEGAAATVDVGDGSAADGWLDGADVNAATTHVVTTAGGTYGVHATTTELPFGKLYKTADTIDVTASAALDTARFTVEALCCRLG